jgi:hypothetical protein
MPVVPFRVFSRVARPDALPSRGVLSELAARSEFQTLRSTALIGFAIPLCRWPFPRLCGLPSPGRASHVKRPVHPHFEFRLPPECCPTQPSSPAAAGQHLSWASAPFSTPGFGGPLLAGFALPTTFRLQGLATLLAAYSLRARAGFISHRRRSWDLPCGAFSSRKVPVAFPRQVDPRTVSPVGIPAAEAMGRPNGPRFLGRHPSGSPWRPLHD